MEAGARKLRGALIGCGLQADDHLHAWREVGGISIVAICDRDGAKARDAAARFGVASVYYDAREMLEREAPDFVDVVTPNASCRALIELAASFGVAVICPGAPAETMAGAEASVAACREAGVALMMRESFRWQGPLLALKSALQSGVIGAPSHARFAFRHGSGLARRGGGQSDLADEAAEALALVRDLMGEATRIFCRTQRIRDAAATDALAIVLDHASGTVSRVDISSASVLHPDPFPQISVLLGGRGGTMEFGTGYRLTVSHTGRHETRDVEPAVPAWGNEPWHVLQDGIVNAQRHFADCLRSGGEPTASGEDHLRTLDLVRKAFESAETGKALAVAERRA